MKNFKDFIKNVPPIVINALPMHGKHSSLPIVINALPMHGKHSTKKSKLKESKGIIPEFKKELPNYNHHLGGDEQEIHDHLHYLHSKFHGKHHEFDKAIAHYTDDSSSINNHAMRGTTPKHDQTVKSTAALDHHLNHDDTKLDHDLHVYHGTSNWNPNEEASKHPHRKIKIPTFVSTSTKPYIAHSFTMYGDGNADASKRHMLHIHLKKGQKGGVFIGSRSASGNEHEHLLPRNKTFTVHKKPTVLSDGTHVWHAHMHDD
jgi:hypothetical protein